MINNNRYSGLIISLILLAGCSVAPSKSIVENIIIKHLETPYYKVTDIVIGNIQEIPTGEKQKRGTTAFMVNVLSLTLEFIKDMGEPWNYKKGLHLTFNDVYIRMEKSSDKKEDWIITNVSGIPLL